MQPVCMYAHHHFQDVYLRVVAILLFIFGLLFLACLCTHVRARAYIHRTWTLLHVSPRRDFPYSTLHSVKVLVLGWLGLFPIVLFAVKYASGTHDDFEWIAKPLSSMAWLFSLWLLNMEVARDLRECWILKTFWGASAVAGTISLPTIILASETNGYGLTFYIYLLHTALYYAISFLAFRYPHTSHKAAPELVGFGGDAEKAHFGFMTSMWRTKLIGMLAIFLPEKHYLAVAFLALCGEVAMTGLALVVVGRLFNNFYYPYAPDSARGHLREYCLVLLLVYALASALATAHATLAQLAGRELANRASIEP